MLESLFNRGELVREFHPVPGLAHATRVTIQGVVDLVVRALYANRQTGELTGENTLAEKSAADFVDAIGSILDEAGLTPPLNG